MKPQLSLSDLPMLFIEWVECDYGIASEGSLSKATLLHMGAAYLQGTSEAALLRAKLDIAVKALEDVKYKAGSHTVNERNVNSKDMGMGGIFVVSDAALLTINEMGNPHG